MSEAPRDQNFVPSALGVSSTDGITVLPFKIDPVTGRLLTDAGGGGSGTVTSFSFTDANGITGVVTNPTTTPNLTLDISGLNAAKIADGSVSNTEFQYLDGVTSNIQTQLNAKGSGTVTSVSVVTANGVSGSVATATTTPAITITLGAITPTSVNGLTISTTTGTFTLTNGKTFSVLKTMSFNAADDTGVYTLPTGTKTLVATDVTTLSSLSSIGTIATGVWQGTKIGLAYGGTNADLSATGGAGQYLKQASAGAAITVGTIPASDIGSGAALTKVDDTNVTLTLGGTPATALLVAASLTLGWTGQLGLTRGGTAASLTASNGGIVYSTSSALAILSGTATAGQILRSGASAAPSWSTATYPATAGTAGKVLISDGTNFVSSTPTYPNSSATAGKIIISDGTNFIASTPTYPNTSATAGKIIVSDGTNFVASTPTYPNASATSRKIIVSDGTNFVASTETWATPGTSGNVLTSDGTNWTSAAPAGGSGTDMFSTTVFTFCGNLGDVPAGSVTTSSTGASDRTEGALQISTGATSGSQVLVKYQAFGGQDNSSNSLSIDFAKNIKWRISVMGIITGTNGVQAWVVGHNIYNSGTDYAQKHLGFRIAGTTVNATNANGTTETTTDITASVTLTQTRQIWDVIFTTGTNAKYYYNGSLLATHTTNLPSTPDGSGDYCVNAVVANPTTAANRAMTLAGLVIQQAF